MFLLFSLAKGSASVLPALTQCDLAYSRLTVTWHKKSCRPTTTATCPVHRATTLPSPIISMCFIRMTALLPFHRVANSLKQALQTSLCLRMSWDSWVTETCAASTDQLDCAVHAATELIQGMREV